MLGAGAFGTVYKGVLRGEVEVAVKTMRVSKITEDELRRFKGELIATIFTLFIMLLIVAFILAFTIETVYARRPDHGSAPTPTSDTSSRRPVLLHPLLLL